MTTASQLTIIGGGLAGSEAAYQAARRGVQVTLYEMRPQQQTPAHTSDRLAEIVCSNSLGSKMIDRAMGLLKEELKRLGSLLISIAEEVAVPAGSALAVDREQFAQRVTTSLEAEPHITIHRAEVSAIPEGPAIIATGPLTSDPLATAIGRLTGEQQLYFYDAMAPIVTADSIDMNICFRASRYGRGTESSGGDYINCPLSKEEYERFYRALLAAPKIIPHLQEEEHFFEACLPIEEIASRGEKALAFGPLRPVGLIDPHSNRRPYAVAQLRQDDLAGSLFNLVGFQTSLRWGAQKEVLRLIPGLQHAKFVRLGQMHRNTYINAPQLLQPTLQFRQRDDLFFAGQICGTEGYVGSIAGGLLAGWNAARLLQDQPLIVLPPTTMSGALFHYITHANPEHFRPMKANFGILPPLEPAIRNKRKRYHAYAQRALASLRDLLPSTAGPKGND